MTVHHCSQCSYSDTDYNKVYKHLLKKHSLSKNEKREAKMEKKDTKNGRR